MTNLEHFILTAAFFTIAVVSLIVVLFYVQRVSNSLMDTGNYLRTALSQLDAYHLIRTDQLSVLNTRIEVIAEALLDIERTFEDYRLSKTEVDYSSSALIDPLDKDEEAWITTDELTEDLMIKS